jgi:hypothetical protein
MINYCSGSVPAACHAVSIFVGCARPLESHCPIGDFRSLSTSLDLLLFLIRGRSGSVPPDCHAVSIFVGDA